ncbi:MAG TPA: hypothetical protein VI758_00830, partial [Bacteroidota bacterium]
MKTTVTFVFLFVGLSICTSFADAQVVDSSLGYFPLTTGNMWEYSYRWAILTNYTLYTITIEGDTLMANGKVYKKMARRQLPNNPRQLSFLRIDSSTAKLYN